METGEAIMAGLTEERRLRLEARLDPMRAPMRRSIGLSRGFDDVVELTGGRADLVFHGKDPKQQEDMERDGRSLPTRACDEGSRSIDQNRPLDANAVVVNRPRPSPIDTVAADQADDSLGSFSRGSGDSNARGSDGSASRKVKTVAPDGLQNSRDSASLRKTSLRKRKRCSNALESDATVRRLDQFFPRTKDSASPDGSPIGERGNVTEVKLDHEEGQEVSELRKCVQDMKRDAQAAQEENEKLTARIHDLNSRFHELEAEGRRSREFESRVDEMQKCIEAMKEKQSKYEEEIVRLVRNQGRIERENASRVLAERCNQLGHISVQRTGTSLHEAWEDGTLIVEKERQLRSVQELRDQTDRLRKDLLRSQKVVRSNPPAETLEVMPPPPPRQINPDQVASVAEQDEIYKLRLVQLKREEALLMDQIDQLESDRVLLAREIRRHRDEKSSRFAEFPLLGDRYVLTRLLGKGGFSEVFKAFDVRNGRWVACKIHQLNSYWSEERKSNYVRHAEREYLIHKSLCHPRVVQFLDVFEIDANSFCTVLEFCDGEDLDQYLKRNKVLAEREAKSILVQVLSGLVYMNEQKQRIIHYDLKPANLLLTNGEVKITDFGLSKIVESDATNDGVELTSQGAGTYWYLPPECLGRSSRPPRISSKVDVWSIGVILYQMLFGKKPFGNDMTQEAISVTRQSSALLLSSH